MARYIARVTTSMSTVEAFSYMADLRNFSEWDPGVVSSVQVKGAGPGLGSQYDVTVKNVGVRSTLRYEVDDFESPNRLRAVGKAGPLTSIDVIDVSAADDGSTMVVYDATLLLPFPLSLGDVLLDRAFQKVGDRAVEGLRRKLDGKLVS
jgi:hypothetical protein